MAKRPDMSQIRACQDRLNVFGPLDERAIEVGLHCKSETGPLQGRLVGLKANIAVNGAVWTAGLGHRRAVVAERDALVTRRLRDSGAVVLPGLNMDPAAMGGATDNPYFGRTLNPHAPECSVGGSSGGSAAAVASGLLDMTLGTDTLGSVRIPASYCGVFGLKPTFGLVGRTGIVPLAPSLDTVGPITARVADLWPLLTVIAGPDADDPTSRPAVAGALAFGPSKAIQNMRIGIPRQIEAVECEGEVLAALTEAQMVLADAGADILPIDMLGWDPALLRQRAFLLTEAEGAVAFADELANEGTLPAAVEGMLRYGANMRTAKLVSALDEINAAKAELDRAFASVDVLLMPTTAQRAFRASEAAPVNQADFTALANAGGVPALAIPMPVPDSPLPTSVQVVGPAWSERALIDLAMVLDTAVA